MRLDGRTVLLGISGGIAAYKTPELVRALRATGARVRPVLTRSAQEFVTPLALQTVAGEPVATELFDLTQESEIGHIDLADHSDVVLIAPASANLIAKAAIGLADDLLTTVLLATRAPIVLAPAMNVNMYENPIVRENLERLRARGFSVLAPDSGSLACGYEGAGRLPDADVLVEAVRTALAPDDLAGERVVITAGPTREYLDPVRFLSNRSSGKMGYALARAAVRRGAEVVLVAGPGDLAPPRGLEMVAVESAAEMAAAVQRAARRSTVVIAAAAVADYRPRDRDDEKSPKRRGATRLALEETPDVVVSAVPRSTRRIVVGFAAETGGAEEKARAKLKRKGLDLIVANDVAEEGSGFDVDTNRVILIDGNDRKALPLLDKNEVADAILDRVIDLRRRSKARADKAVSTTRKKSAATRKNSTARRQKSS
jgi:phosphopantothenoylcysteine decarboxylase/phosphopantothenate--cysteine ligase